MTRITSKKVETDVDQGSVTIYTQGSQRISLTDDGGIAIGAATDKVSFFGGSPVAVQATTATTGTFTAGTGTAAVSGSSWVGNVGTKSYSVSDIVTALKNYGILTS